MFDPIHRQTASGTLRLAQPVEIRGLRADRLLALVHRIESRALLVVQRRIEIFETRPHGPHRFQHGIHA